MTITIGNSTYGPFNNMLQASDSLQTQISTLQQQTTTGLVAQSYAGLGAASSQVLDLSASSSKATAYNTTITTAQGRASVMQNALTQIGSMVSTMAASALALTSSTNQGVSTTAVAQQALSSLQQLGSLLNSSFQGDYVFSGADSANPPVPSAQTITSSGMYTQIAAQVAALATTPTSPSVATVISNTVAIASSNVAGTTVFSSYLAGAGLTAQPGTVQIANDQHVSLGMQANQNVPGSTSPTTGTGNAISDVMRALSVLANSTSAMAANPDFTTLLKDAANTLTSAGSTLAQEAGNIGATQNTMTAATASNTALQTILTTQLSGLTQVNMANAISQLQAVSNQLTASYKVIAMAGSLNLASYIS